jgi:hypothetical protein
LQEGHIMLIPLMVKLLFAKWPQLQLNFFGQ